MINRILAGGGAIRHDATRPEGISCAFWHYRRKKADPARPPCPAIWPCRRSSPAHGPVCLIDIDPQGSLADWWNEREADMPAFAQTTVARLAADLEVLRQQGFRLAVIDTPPAITMAIQSVIQVAELVVIPTRPSPHDLRAVGATVDLCDRAGKPLIFVVNGATPKAQDHLRSRGRAVAARHGRSGHAAPPHRFRGVDDRRPHGDGGRSQGHARRRRSSQLWDYVADRLEKNFRRTVFSAPSVPSAHASMPRPAGGFGRRVAGQ